MLNLNISEVVEDLMSDLKLDDVSPKAVVIQEAMWPDVLECRIIVADNCYSALYKGDEKISDYVEIKKEEKPNA